MWATSLSVGSRAAAATALPNTVDADPDTRKTSPSAHRFAPPPIGHHTPCAAAIVARCPLPPSLATGKFTGEQYRAEALTRLCTPTPDR